MLTQSRRLSLVSILLGCFVGSLGCGSPEGAVLVVDAEFDPVAASDAFGGLNEATTGIAQTFTVQNDGRFERFWIVLTQGNSADDGTVRITVRPLVGGLPDPSPASSIIVPIDVDTSTLPATLVETFTIFDVGDDPGRNVLVGETYAIVVEFVSRTTSTDTNPICLVLGISGVGGDPFAGGVGAEDNGAGYVQDPTMDDYIFRTFVLTSP